jgi:signal transduction histidine kinase
VNLNARPVGEGLFELLFTVRDTGPGIDPKRLDRLFEPYVQDDALATPAVAGTGLGLAIAKRLAERMGGKLWAESQPREGSTFYFCVSLRMIRPEARPISKRPPAADEMPSVPGLIADLDGHGRQILRSGSPRG